MSELPSGWAEARIGDLADLNPKQAFDDEVVAGFVPMSHAPTTFRDKLRFDERPWGDIKKAYTNFKDGDVIFAKVTPCFENGKAAFVEGLPNGIGAGSSEFFVLRPSCEDISAKYLLGVVKSRDFLREGAANMTGAVGLRRVPKQFVESYPVLVPPAAEQTRIAAKLDELLAQVDTLKARIDGIPALLKRFRQSVLAAAVSGRLTEEWRGGASEWVETTIGEICSVATGKTPKRDAPEYWAGGDIPWLTSAATGTEFCSEAEQFVTEFAVKDCVLKIFQPGTLLMAMYGEGKTRGQVTELRLAAACNQACAAITVDEALAKKAFVKIRLQENYEEVRKQAVGGAQPNLNLNKVREISICLPSLEEQTEIVRRVEQLFAFADQLEAKVNEARTRIDRLTQSILAKAFRGELVPQDPNDEPASELLARITAQRANATKAKRGRKSG